MVAQKEEERLFQTIGDHAAKRSAIQIDSGFAPAIVMTKLERGGASKGMPDDSQALHVPTASEAARRLTGIQPHQLVDDELRILDPGGQDRLDKTALSAGCIQVVGIGCRRPEEHAPIREYRDTASVRRTTYP